MFKSLLRFKNNLALFDEKNKIFYKDFLEKEKFLKNSFIKKRAVLVICENKISILYYYVLMHIFKASLILIDFKTKDKEVKKIIKRYEPDFVVTNMNRKKKTSNKL